MTTPTVQRELPKCKNKVSFLRSQKPYHSLHVIQIEEQHELDIDNTDVTSSYIPDTDVEMRRDVTKKGELILPWDVMTRGITI